MTSDPIRTNMLFVVTQVTAETESEVPKNLGHVIDSFYGAGLVIENVVGQFVYAGTMPGKQVDLQEEDKIESELLSVSKAFGGSSRTIFGRFDALYGCSFSKNYTMAGPMIFELDKMLQQLFGLPWGTCKRFESR